MRKIELKGHKVTLYDSIDEMPVYRYHKFTQLMVLGDGIGNDIKSINGKIDDLIRMVDEKKPELAKVELLNLRQTFFFIDKAVDPKSMAFACLVAEVDGEPFDDISGNRLKEMSENLDRWASKRQRDGDGRHPGLLGWIKKKLEGELKYYYPEHTDTDGEANALLRRSLVRRIERLQEAVKDGKDINEKDPELNRIYKRLREKRWDTLRNYATYERESDTAFEQGCLAITGELHKDVKQMTVMEYHAAMKLLEERAKDMEKARSKNK